MAILAVFIMVLFSASLQANANGKVIQDNMKVCEQDDVTLSCGAASTDNRWKIRTSYGRRTRVPDIPSKYGFMNTSLIIKNVQPSDTKSQYICSTKSPIHHFRITYVYTLKIVCKDIEAFAGSILDLKCNVDIPDDEIDRIDWKFRYKDQRKTLRSDHRTSIVGKMLSVKSVAMSDSGTFTCIASRKALHRSRETFFYNLLVVKAPQTTAAVTTTAVSMTTTTSPTTASTTKIPNTTEDTSRKPSTIPTISTTTESPVEKRVTTDRTTTQEVKPSTVTTATIEHEMTEEDRPTTKPTQTDGNSIPELPTTLNPKHRARLTTQRNAIDSGNDNQLGGKAPTTPQSVGSTVSAIYLTTVVGLCAAVLLPFYLT